MKNIDKTSEELKKLNCLKLNKDNKKFSNCNFWYYTNLYTANLILENKSVHISNISIMNDIDEAVLHSKDKEFIHCFCLCNSNTEKIPMWYLYSGITGQGVSLGFTPSTMLKLIESIETVTTIDKKVTLKKDVDFDLDYGWIFYRKKEDPTKVMFKSKWYSLKDPENFESNNFFIKSYPWEYEKEFRIIIRNKTNQKYDKLVLNISEVYEKIKIKLAPELSNDQFLELLFSHGLKGFLKFFDRTLQKSKLSINMNLCERNFKVFLNYIKEDRYSNIKYNEICDAISCHCRKKGDNK